MEVVKMLRLELIGKVNRSPVSKLRWQTRLTTTVSKRKWKSNNNLLKDKWRRPVQWTNIKPNYKILLALIHKKAIVQYLPYRAATSQETTPWSVTKATVSANKTTRVRKRTYYMKLTIVSWSNPQEENKLERINSFYKLLRRTQSLIIIKRGKNDFV